MEENKTKDWKEMFESPLKKYSTEKIEEIIAQCLSILVGEELEAAIKLIDYSPNKKGGNIDCSVEIRLEISKPFKNTLNNK